MIHFVTVLAYMLGVFSFLWMCTNLLMSIGYSYDKNQRVRDALHGFKRDYNIWFPAVISIVCWVWVIITASGEM